MIKIIDVPAYFAMCSFGIISITSPLVGVFVGGFLSDSLVPFEKTSILKYVGWI
jgi:hypothetical protein